MSKNKYGWAVVFTTVMNQGLVMGILLAGFALLVVPWVETFDLQISEAMTSITLLLMMNSLLSPIAGKYMDKISLRNMIIFGILCMAVGLTVIAHATEYWMIIAMYATLLPLALVMCGSLSSQTLISRWFVEGRGMALGISSLGSSIGGLLLPAMITALIASFTWNKALLILALAIITILLPLNFLILSREPKPQEASKPSKTQASTDQTAVIEPKWTTAMMLKEPMFWLPILGFIPIMGAFSGVQFNFGAYMNELRLDQSIAAQLIMSLAVGQVVGKLIMGALGDKFDHRVLYWLLAVSISFAMFMFMGSPSIFELYLGAALLGFAAGGTLPMMPIIYASRFGTRSMGSVLGFVTLFLVVGSFGSLFAGYIYDKTQSYETAFVIFALLPIIPSIAMFFLKSPEKARADWS